MREKLGAIASFIVDSYRHDPDLMKVIIVEVTRAANSFGQTHLGEIREAYELIGKIVERAQAEGAFKPEIEPRFAAMSFYGAIEQLLTGWIFGLLPQGEAEFERAKWLVVETVCGGLEVGSDTPTRAGAGASLPPGAQRPAPDAADPHRTRATCTGRGLTRAVNRLPAQMENEMVKRLMWSGLLAGLGALSSVVVQRVAGLVWRRLFDEEPPE